MTDQRKRAEESREETETDTPLTFDPWDAAFTRDLQRDDREFEF
jgi:hypothetical protein